MTPDQVLGLLVPHHSGCVLWVGGIMNGGYGRVYWNGRSRTIHQVAYEEFYGPIPENMFVLHRCDVRNCANPAHLWLGTQKDNILDAVSKGRMVKQKMTECMNGHPYTPETTTVRERGHRVCRVCERHWANSQRRRKGLPIRGPRK